MPPACADLELREGALTAAACKGGRATAGEIRHLTYQPVFVLDADGKKLAPCHPARARQLLAKGRADVAETCPFQIKLRRRVEHPVVEEADLKLDAGSKHVGFALVGTSGCVYLFGELTLRTDVKARLDWRRICRRGRRGRKTRYRKPRFDNRRRPEGWLPPSLRSRVEATARLARMLERLLPVCRIVAETAAFDVHRLVNPEVHGEAYQRGPLYRTDLRRYLYAKHHGKCAYCRQDLEKAWEADHVIPKSRGGSDRWFNRVASCVTCNQEKASRTAEEFGHPATLAHAKEWYAPAAIVTATRASLVRELQRIAPVIETDGARTSANRKALGLDKSNAHDAVCALEVPQALVLPGRLTVAVARARGTRQLVNGTRGEHKIRLGRQVKGFRQWDQILWSGRLCYVKGRRVTGSFLLADIHGMKLKDGVGYKRIKLARRVRGIQFEGGARLLPTAEAGGFRRAGIL